MRLFYAIGVPDDLRAELLARAAVFAGDAAVRLVPIESLHVTLRFIGEVADNRLEAVAGAGARAASGGPFTLRLSGGGAFPDPRHPKVFWAAVTDGAARLGALNAALVRELTAAGVAGEPSVFRPHLTLARSRGSARPTAALSERFTSHMAGYASPSFVVKEFDLYRSHLGPTGPRYEVLRSFPLS